jgi:hypothetical protein
MYPIRASSPAGLGAMVVMLAIDIILLLFVNRLKMLHYCLTAGALTFSTV